jgi:hypothetical protein
MSLDDELAFVNSLPHRLRIKYGLNNYPTDAQIAEWLSSTAAFIDRGMDAEDAGRRAALEAFGELDAVLLFSEADTIAALLARAAAKD